MDYFQTSTCVHCSSPAIDNYFVDDMKPFKVSQSGGPQKATQATLFTVLIYVHRAISYALFGMGGEGSRKLDSLFSDALEEMKPVPRRTGGPA